MSWPNTADGDVFRRLEADNFDFSQVVDIDINIDFDDWPLSEECIRSIHDIWPDAKIIDPDDEDLEEGNDIGWVTFQIRDRLTYEMIVNVQKDVSEKMKRFGGRCESWGVFSN